MGCEGVDFFIGEVDLYWEVVEEVGVGLGVSGLTARVCRRVASNEFSCLSLFCVAWCLEMLLGMLD